MKKLTHLAAGITLTCCAFASTSAFAEVSYNIGWASEYYYRGLLQKESSASAGIDYEESNFYAGAWAADVGDGIEVDGYFGYGFETEQGLSGSLGFTGYYYTGEFFDDTYEEINLGLGYGFLSMAYTVGEWKGFGTSEDYDVLEFTLENSGFYGTFGTLGDQFKGEWFEVGYGSTISEIDYGIALIFSSDDFDNGEYDNLGNNEPSEALVFTISKSF
jgi:uncharacterized protein (TIGR02001 family)